MASMVQQCSARLGALARPFKIFPVSQSLLASGAEASAPNLPCAGAPGRHGISATPEAENAALRNSAPGGNRLHGPDRLSKVTDTSWYP